MGQIPFASRIERLRAVCVLSLGALALVLAGHVAAAPVPEYELKAAFIYNFMLFTEWPEDTAFEDGNLQLCMQPDNPLRGAVMAALADRQVKGRRVVMRAQGLTDAIRSCHVLVLDAADRGRWPALRKSLAYAPVLTIVDDREHVFDGAIIALALEQGRVVFDIDTRVARKAQLTLSSKLLRLAREVR